MAGMAGLDRETLELTLEAIRDFARDHFPDEILLDLDHEDEFPCELVRRMCGADLGVQLLFIPEAYGGMGGGAFDVYKVCEVLARADRRRELASLRHRRGRPPARGGGRRSPPGRARR